MDLILNEPADLYHATSAVSSHRLGEFVRSPRGYALSGNAIYSRSQTQSLSFGTLVHLLTLEPAKRATLAIDAPVNPKTGKPYGPDTEKASAWAAAARAMGLTPCSEAEVTLADLLAANCREVVGSVLTHEGPGLGWHAEAVLRGQDTIVGTIQARPDLLSTEHRAMIDLKTCRSLDGFKWSVREYGYDLQAAWYLWLAGQLDEADPAWMAKPYTWRWLVVETEAPYRAKVFKWDSIIADASKRLPGYLRSLAECRTNGVWPLTLDEGVKDLDA